VIPVPLLTIKDSAKDAFIYKWSPFELGIVENGQLKIIKTLDSKLPKNIRGSSVPIRLDDEMCEDYAGEKGGCRTQGRQDLTVLPLGERSSFVCVVHYCEHGQQGLEYYHMLVKLNSEFEPVQSSNPFYFNKIGIQYCIGFTIEEPSVPPPSRETSSPLAESSIPLLEKNKKLYFWFSEHDSNPGLMIL